MVILDPYQLNLTIAALANTIACKLSDNELEAAALIIIQLGESLENIAAQREICNKNKGSSSNKENIPVIERIIE